MRLGIERALGRTARAAPRGWVDDGDYERLQAAGGAKSIACKARGLIGGYWPSVDEGGVSYSIATVPSRAFSPMMGTMTSHFPGAVSSTLILSALR